MRPLKLTMTAFGPYAGIEVIDFTKLNNRNIFLITGPTGAGKTTIFDGISFAVFGNASSDERDGESLRSHFASEDLLTSVELEFELRETKYYIKRIPKQLKKRSRGEGFTEQKTEAYLKAYKDEYQEGGGYEASGVSSVNEKIGQILGINYDQFRQIMMIPQGEFRKLITADSQDREKILQKIFGTVGFKKVQEKLGDMAKNLSSEAKNYSNRIDENIHNIDCSENESLKVLISNQNMNKDEIQDRIKEFVDSDIQLESDLNKKIGNIEKESVLKSKEIFSAQENNKKFKYRDEVALKKVELESKLPEFDIKKEKLIKGRKALNLIGIEENHESKIKSVKLKEEELNSAKNSVTELEKKLIQAKNEYEKQEKKEPERQKLLQQRGVLTGHVDKVKKLDEKNKNIGLLQLEANSLGENLKNKKIEIAKDKEKLKRLNDELKKSREAKDMYYEMSSKLDKKNKIFDKFHAVLDQNEKLNLIRETCIKERENFIKIKEAYDTVKTNYEKLQELFFKGQAGFLSSKLEPGDPCPVCGATSHPNLAKAITGIPDEESIKSEKDKLSKAQEKYNEINESYSKLLGEGNAQREIVEKLKGEVDNIYLSVIKPLEKNELSSYVRTLLKRLEVDIKLLKDETIKMETMKMKEEGLSTSIINTDKNIEKNEEEYEKTDKLFRESTTKLNTEKELLLSIKAELPEGIDSEDKLLKLIKSLENSFEMLKQVYDRAEKEYRAVNVKHEKALTSLMSSKDNLKEASDELKVLGDKFNSEVKLAGFLSAEDYKANKLTPDKVESLDKEINKFNENLKSITDSLLKAEKEIEGLETIESKKLENQLLEINSAKSSLIKEKTHVFARRKHNGDTLASMMELKINLEKVEEQYKILGNLANVARGFNSEKITFERYVLAAFFDDIISAANLRLTKMTGNRFEMSRITEKSKGNVQSGLEIEVLDNYTGRSRHIKTLSGGESFKASLSLALGLADVVQSYAGGISLDTMFIDEGFGTLDPESLDSAIQSLIDLQNTGRLVGIISHVPELKERIDARLEIIPSRQGSRTEFNV